MTSSASRATRSRGKVWDGEVRGDGDHGVETDAAATGNPELLPDALNSSIETTRLPGQRAKSGTAVTGFDGVTDRSVNNSTLGVESR